MTRGDGLFRKVGGKRDPLPRRMQETGPYRCQSGGDCTRTAGRGEHATRESAEACHQQATR